MRVLVVDDNATNRRILREYVKAWGCIPTAASSAAEALEELRAAVRDQPYRLVLTDAQTPEMDGFDLTRAIRADPALKGATVLILSSVGAGISQEVRAAGAAGYVTKPIRRSDLFDAVVEALAPSAIGRRGQSTKVTVPHWPEDDGTPLRVLLAEDNPVNRKVTVHMLGKSGHSVDVVTTGTEAIEALEARPYDLVLMDVQMPKMDGLEATRRIRANPRFADIPIIALTAHAMAGDRDQCLAAGMDDYVSKPFDQSQLLAKLNQWRRSPAHEPGSKTPHPVTAPARPTGILDMSALVEAVDGDVEFAESLIVDFLAYAEEQLEEMDAAAASGDADEAANLAHGIEGAAANLTAESVREAARRIGAIRRNGDLTGMPQVVAHLKTEVARLAHWAQRELSTADAPSNR